MFFNVCFTTLSSKGIPLKKKKVTSLIFTLKKISYKEIKRVMAFKSNFLMLLFFSLQDYTDFIAHFYEREK